jgi:hypothetical protein
MENINEPPSCKTAKTTEESAPAPQSGADQVLNHDQLEELFNEEVRILVLEHQGFFIRYGSN